MIVSHKHKFIFIKTHKTAGTSIEIALSSICGKEDVITNISPKDRLIRSELGYLGKQNTNISLKNYRFSDYINSFTNRKRKKFERHFTAMEIKSNLSNKLWKNYFKFSIERNPYDRIVSLFYWRGGFEKYQSVYDFIIQTTKSGLCTTDKYIINGKLAVDKVYQFEKLDAMMTDLTKRLNLQQPLQLPSYRAKSFTRKEKDYRKVLDQEAKAWIEENYADVIERFGYEW